MVLIRSFIICIFSSNVIRIVKSTRPKWARLVASVVYIRNVYEVLSKT
jgi:hypothetical protein